MTLRGPRNLLLPEGMRLFAAVTATLVAGLAPPPAAAGAGYGPEPLARAGATVAVAYRTEQALRAALRLYDGRVVSRLASVNVAEVRPEGSAAAFAAAVRRLPGIDAVEAPRARVSTAEPALVTRAGGAPLQWQYEAVRAHEVPAWALRAASAVTIAVVDTGADLAAPDLAAKRPSALDLATGSNAVDDPHGHGTFVASLAAGSVTNGDGIAGLGGDARLLVIKAGAGKARFTDIDEARAIVAAVERGARIINVSFGGARTSATEQRAVDYAVSKGVLLVAAVGNEFARGNAVQYPAALLQPTGSRGVGGKGLAVAASTSAGTRAAFSSTGTWVSLAAPGENVFGALSSRSSPAAFPRVPLPGATRGLYGFGSGTSFAAPQVAGAAAVVWAANPSLTAADVARILEETAQGGGHWTPELGFGVIDVAAAVAAATGTAAPRPPAPDMRPQKPRLKLAASRTSARPQARVALTATLEGTIAPGDGEIALELLGRSGWRETARASVGADGKATWRVSLGVGRYKLRARHETLTSRPVAIAIRR